MTPRLNADDIAAMGIGHLQQAIRTQADALIQDIERAHVGTDAVINKSAAQRTRVRFSNLHLLGKAYRKATTQPN